VALVVLDFLGASKRAFADAGLWVKKKITRTAWQ
jgi:hypothetical protein